MKKSLLLFIGMAIAGVVFAQKKKNDENGVVIKCSDFHITAPLSEMFGDGPGEIPKKDKREESEDRENRRPQKFKKSVKDGLQYGNDPKTLQTEMGDVPGRAPIMNWTGQQNSNFRPMDPCGAAGTNHYIQMINSTTFKIFSKTGTILLTGTLGNLWSPATANAGDPIVLYDKAADRWMMSQFGSSSDKKIYIAISQTPDPTGSWYTYTYTSPEFPDYLKFSVWQDGYYMTSNQTQKVFCFERSAMLAGNSGARSIYKTFSPPQGSGFFVPLPGDTGDGTLAPAGTPCPIFSYSDNGWGNGFSDAINIYKMAVNWGSTATATITSAGSVPTGAFDGTYNSSWNDCSQPGTTQKLDGIGGVLNFRAQFKIWNGYNTVVLNWAVKINSTQRSIKWCELRQDQSSGTWSMYQEGIYTPDSDTRWLGSIAMDNNGAIALCYLKSNSTSVYPSLCYTGRRACDPLGTLPITEVVAKAGGGSQTGVNRVGDYSATWLDPDGVTFWHTGEYMASGGTAKTQIYSFQLPVCANVASVNVAVSAGSNPACPGTSVTFTAAPTNGGSNPTYQWQVNGNNVGTNSPTYTTSTLNNGDVVTCIMTSNMSGVTGSPATSNSVTMTISTVTPSVTVAGNSTICSGGTATFTATPTNGGSTPTYQWQVNGNNVGTNSATYTSTTLTAGQIVTCVMTSGLSCASPASATSNSVTMSVTASATLPFIENFEGTTFPPTGWTIDNPDAPSIAWGTGGAKGIVKRSAAGNTGSTVGCAGIECWNYPDTTQVDNLISKPIDLTGAPNAKMTFKRAYKYYNSSTNPQFYHDELRIYVSTDCGATFGSALWYKKGAQLATNGTTNSSYTPSSTADWVMDSINLAAYVNQSVIIKFEITNRYGNNLYLDDINVNAPAYVPTASVSISANGTTSVCTGGSISFTASPTNGGSNPSYQWQVDGNNVGTNSSTFTSSTLTNGQVVTCILTSNLNNVTGSPASSNTISVTVSDPVAPSVTVSQTSGTNTICAGSGAAFVASATNGGGSPTYQWQVNGSNVGGNSSSYSSTGLNNGDVVTCILVSNAACATPSTVSSNSITMVVESLPATPTISQNGDVLTSSSATGNQWYFNGTLIPGATGQTYTCTQDGDYTVTVTDNGCISAESNPTNVVVSGIAELDAETWFLKVYPNPNDGVFVLSFNAVTKANYKVELFNSLGQLIYKENLSNFNGQYNKTVNVTDYGKGIYSLRLYCDAYKKQIVKRVVID